MRSTGRAAFLLTVFSLLTLVILFDLMYILAGLLTGTNIISGMSFLGYLPIYLFGIGIYWTPLFQEQVVGDREWGWKIGVYLIFLLPIIGTIGLGGLLAHEFGFRTLATWVLKSVEKSGSTVKSTLEWIRQNPKGLLSFTLLILLLFSGYMTMKTPDSGSSTTPTTATSSSETRDFVNTSLGDIQYELLSSNSQYTDLQKKELWRSNYRGKWIKGQLYAHSVDEKTLGGYVMLAGVEPKGRFDFTSPFRIEFEDSERRKLLQVSKNEQVTIEGQLQDYGGIPTDIKIGKATIQNTE